MISKFYFYLWADADEGIGLGHLTRIRNFSQELKKKGAQFKIVTKSNQLSRKLIRNNVIFNKESINYYVSKFKIPKFIIHRKNKINVIIIDSYSINKNYINFLKINHFKIIYFNDLRKSLNADLNICLGSKLNKKNYLSGLSYVPLSKEYTATKEKLLEKKTILITFGAIDHYDLTTKVFNQLKKFDLKFIIIIGKYYNKKIITNILKFESNKIKLIYQPKSLFKYYKKSDSVICAGGFTVFESLSLGIPTLSIEIWKNQSENLNILKQNNCIKFIKYNKHKDFKFNNNHLNVFFDPVYRDKVSIKTKKIISGKGSSNILKEVIKKFK